MHGDVGSKRLASTDLIAAVEWTDEERADRIVSSDIKVVSMCLVQDAPRCARRNYTDSRDIFAHQRAL